MVLLLFHFLRRQNFAAVTPDHDGIYCCIAECRRKFRGLHGKTVFCVRIIKEFLRTIFLFFSYKVHLHSIFTVVLKQASYKKCHDNVLANVIFRTSYFLNKTILRKSKKNGPALITLLGNGVFILMKKRTDKPVSDKNHDHV